MAEIKTVTEFPSVDETYYSEEFISLNDGTITRVSDLISVVAKTGRTLTITRSSGRISTISDGTYTWSFTRNGQGRIISWNVV